MRCCFDYLCAYCNSLHHTAAHCNKPENDSTYNVQRNIEKVLLLRLPLRLLQHPATPCNTLQQIWEMA